MLTHKEAQKFYDSFGRKQDKQFYEESALNELITHSNFSEAKNIIEFGCGTGKFASRLLKDILPDNCHYLGIDISQTMIDLCKKNIQPYSERSKCIKINGETVINAADQTIDRFVSTYVLDLLSENDSITLLDEAHRVLLPGGYLCLANLTGGISLFSHFVEIIWNTLYKLKPAITGGCRPIHLMKYLSGNKWQIIHHNVIVSYGVPSEVIIARRI